MNDVEQPSEEQLKELLTSVEDLTSKDPELAKFCSSLTLKRYLLSRSNKVDAASKKLRETLLWRQSYRPQDIKFKEIRDLASTGRLEVLDTRDLEGRPVLCYRLSRKNLGGLQPDEHLRFMLFNLESASKLADENGVGKMTWLMDMDNYDSSQSVPIMTQRKIINILQAHYPERLGLILIMRANSVFQAVYYVVKHFLDPVTRKKLVFLNDTDDEKMKEKLLQHVSPNLLNAAFSCRKPDAAFDVEPYEMRMTALQAR